MVLFFIGIFYLAKLMSQKIIIFCALYLVLLQGVLLSAISLLEPTLVLQVAVFVSGTILLLLSVTTSKLLKRIIHKARPAQEELFIPYDKYAFPSSHAAGLASISFFIFPYDIFLGLVSTVISLIIVDARVRSRVHDVYDIVAGLFLGVIVTSILYDVIVRYVTFYLVPTFIPL